MVSTDESDYLREVFPDAQRRELDHWWLALQVEELSALGDQLRHLQREGHDEETMAGVLRRVAAVQEAVWWNRAAVVDELPAQLGRVGELLHPEDAFGLALVCDALGAELVLGQLVAALDGRTLALLRGTPGWPEEPASRDYRRAGVHVGSNVSIGPGCSIGGVMVLSTTVGDWADVTETDPEALMSPGNHSRRRR